MQNKALEGTVVGKMPRGRPGRRRVIPENVVNDVPFLKVSNNGLQATLNRDVIAALGRPSHVLWVIPTQQADRPGAIRLVAANIAVAGAYVVTYSRRMTAITTVPAAVRGLGLQPRRYRASGWSQPTAQGPRFVEFPLAKVLVNNVQ